MSKNIQSLQEVPFEVNGEIETKSNTNYMKNASEQKLYPGQKLPKINKEASKTSKINSTKSKTTQKAVQIMKK